MKQIKLSNIFCPITLVLIVFCASTAIASGPWKYVMSLPDTTAELRLGEALSLTVDDERQRYYVVDSSHGQLVSFDSEGTFLTALNPGNRLQKPVSLALAKGGRLWVVERSSNQLLQVNLKDQQVRAFTLAAGEGEHVFPDKIALDDDGNLYVLDRGRGIVVRLDDNLRIVQSFVGEDGFKGFVDFRLTKDGLWLLDSLNRNLVLLTYEGKLVRQVPLTGEMEFPVAFDIDATGHFYLLDRHAGKVLVFDSRGDLSYDLLLKGKRQGRLWYPSDLMFDWQGRLCVVNEGNGRVDIYSR